jgi:hypothetical protein
MSERKKERKTNPRVDAVARSAHALGRAARDAGLDTAEFWKRRWREEDGSDEPANGASVRVSSSAEGWMVCAFCFVGADKDDMRISFHDDNLEVSAARRRGRNASDGDPVSICCRAPGDEYDYDQAEILFKHETLTVVLPHRRGGAASSL